MNRTANMPVACLADLRGCGSFARGASIAHQRHLRHGSSDGVLMRRAICCDAQPRMTGKTLHVGQSTTSSMARGLDIIAQDYCIAAARANGARGKFARRTPDP